MTKILPNTIFVMEPKTTVRMEGDAFVLRKEDGTKGVIPAINIEALVLMGAVYASSRVLSYCAQHGILVSYFSASGRFLFKIDRTIVGSNVLLRRAQHEATKEEHAHEVARAIVLAKLVYQRQALQRYKRDYASAQTDVELEHDIAKMAHQLRYIEACDDVNKLRGHEGWASGLYFKHFDKRILKNKKDFFFHSRHRRPPMDRVNAMLSFGYGLLYHDMAGVLEAVGLDPGMGFLHRDRPGRMSLALDLMESFRVVTIDRLVLRLINLQQVKASDFEVSQTGSVRMKDKTRKLLVTEYAKQKREVHEHAYTLEKAPLQQIWYIQAQLLARYLRGNLTSYPAYALK